MLENVKQLELSAKDIALIEAALHTQEKILSVQREAGGAFAHEKLSDLKHLLKRVRRARPQRAACMASVWTYLAGSLFGVGSKRCHE